MYHKGGDGKPRGFGFGGFSLGSKKQEPPVAHSLSAMPPPTMVNKHGYTGLQAITQNALDATYGIPRKRPKTEEE